MQFLIHNKALQALDVSNILMATAIKPYYFKYHYAKCCLALLLALISLECHKILLFRNHCCPYCCLAVSLDLCFIKTLSNIIISNHYNGLKSLS